MKLLPLILAALLLIACAWYAWQVFTPAKKGAQVVIAGRVTYDIEIAQSAMAKAQGLGGRESMPEHQGMLFPFDTDEVRYFWMGGMLMPLDVVWARDGKIIGLQANIPHPGANNGETARFQSPEPADMVLELNAGQIAKHGLKIGDSLDVISTFR